MTAPDHRRIRSKDLLHRRGHPHMTHWSVLAASYSSSYFIRLRCAPESPPKPSEREPRRPAVIGATTTLILRLSPAMVAAIDKRTKAGGTNRSEAIRRLSDWRQRSRICRRQSMNRACPPFTLSPGFWNRGARITTAVGACAHRRTVLLSTVRPGTASFACLSHRSPVVI